MARYQQIKRAAIDIALGATGNQALIAAVTGKKIRVLSLVLGLEAAQTTPGAGFRSANNVIGGALVLGAAAILTLPPVAPADGAETSGWLETNASEALNVNLTVASRVSGWIVYQEI